MDKFEALPLPQKILVGFLACALLAGGFQFMFISDAEARIAAAQGKLKSAEKKAAGLKKYEDETLFNQVRQEEAELKEALANNKAMLPDHDEIPKLISSIKRQADERGLKILMFKKEDRMADDYVDIVPVEMEVEGSFPVVVSFFEALAQPGMRMMTVHGFEMKALGIKELLEATHKIIGGPPQAKKDASKNIIAGEGGAASPVAQLIRRIEDYETAVNRMRVNASFTVHAYSYTGNLLSPEEAAAKAKRNKKKKRKR